MLYNHSTGYFEKSEQPEVLDQTQSGKGILSSAAESYSGGFSDQDHLDAKKVHEQHASHHDQTARSLMSGIKFNHKAIAAAQERASFHRKQADWHNNQVDREEPIQKSVDEAFDDFMDQYPGILDDLSELEKAEKKAAFRQKLKGGKADDKKPSDFDSEALSDGIKVEMEHTDDPDTAKEIAMDHLEESEDYYKELEEMEQKMKKSSYSPDLTGKDTLFLEENPKEKRRLFRDKLSKKQGVPKGVDPAKHERCVKDVKKQGHDKSSAYAICNASIKKSFRDKLSKGGPGSGKKGHKTFKPRKPYPGEEQHKLDGSEKPDPKKTHEPSGGWQPHYSDTPGMARYKKLKSLVQKEGHDFHGNFSYDQETDKVHTTSDKGKEIFSNLQEKFKSKKEQPAKNENEVDLTPKEYWNLSEKEKDSYNKKKGIK